MIEVDTAGSFGKEVCRPTEDEFDNNAGNFPRYGYFSRRKMHFCQCPKINSYSKQSGASVTNRLVIPGRWNFDIYLDVKASWKLPSYGLDDVGMHFIGQRKIPLPAKDQFEYFLCGLKENPTPEDIDKSKKLDEYCKKDCQIPKGLFQRFNLRDKYAGSCLHTGL